jgi:hypothetical protein
MSTAQLAAPAEPDPIIIYRSVDRDGETYALEPRSLQRLREAFGPAVHSRARIFLTHETRADYEHVQGNVAPQIVMLLTGLSEDRMKHLCGVMFRDPVTDRDLPRTRS